MKAAVVVAAGKSTRLGIGTNKALLLLKDTPLFVFSLEKFKKAGFQKLVVVCRPEEARHFAKYAKAIKDLEIVSGGARRQDSVCNALKHLKAHKPIPDLVAVHDAARPFFDEKLLHTAEEVLRDKEVSGVIYAHRISDTVKRVNAEGVVLNTLNRDELIAVQTPQLFKFDLLYEAYQTYGKETFTDDAAIIERAGGVVKYVESSRINLKITTKADWLIAQALAGEVL